VTVTTSERGVIASATFILPELPSRIY